MTSSCMQTERVVVYFTGRVQGVGFRYTCRSLAMGFAVTGYVKNLPDARVELVAEGERQELEDFLQSIEASHLKSFIRSQKTDWRPPTAQWKDFHIEH